MSISNYSRISEQPGTARQIVGLGVAFAIVVAGLIAFNLILERVSLLDGLKKDVTALAQVHANHAEREISEYDSLLKALADRVSQGNGFGHLVAQRQSFDPALVEARLLAPCAGTGCPSAIAGAASANRRISGLLMVVLPGSPPGTDLLARSLAPADAATPGKSGGLVALAIDLNEMAQGLQGTSGKLTVSLTFASGAPAKNTASGPVPDKGYLDSTLWIAGLPVAATVGMPIGGELELWRQHVAAGAALAAILIAGIAGAVRILLWLSARQNEAIARVFKSEQALQEQEALQQSLIEAIPLPLSMRNEKGIFIRCNRAFLDLTLRQRDEVLGRTSAELFGRDTAKLFDQGIAEALTRATPIRFEMSLTDAIGANRDVTIYRSAHHHADGEAVTIVSVAVDETDRKRVESELRESEERFHLAVRGSNDGIWDWDLRSGRIWVSARWRRCSATGKTNWTTPWRCGRA